MKITKHIILLILMIGTAMAENIWFTATGEKDGKSLIYRSMKNIPEGSKISDYPYLISIYWPYNSGNDSGMPDKDTNDSQVEFEDALQHLDKMGISHLMLVVTGNNRKEWHWYVTNVKSWMEKLNEALKGKSTYPIEIENSYEPDWKLYHEFVAGVKGI